STPRRTMDTRTSGASGRDQEDEAAPCAPAPNPADPVPPRVAPTPLPLLAPATVNRACVPLLGPPTADRPSAPVMPLTSPAGGRVPAFVATTVAVNASAWKIERWSRLWSSIDASRVPVRSMLRAPAP